MRKLLLILALIFFIYNISASCEEGQIDINTATAEELKGIIHIGPSRAEQMITLRPFDSVDDMIRILGIGEIYLADIIAEGLACVNGVEEDKKSEEEVDDNENPIEETASQEIKTIELQTIVLNPQVIKTDENKEEGGKNYAVYGFVAFCILIGILFIIKNRKDKNEFG